MMKTKELLEVYRSLFSTWRFEVNSHWQRSSYFAAFETVAIAACWTVLTDSSGQRWAGPVLAVLGIALTAVWFFNNNKTHEYAVYCLESVGALERKLMERTGEQGIDFAVRVRARTRKDFIYIKHPYLVQSPPVIFLIAWLILLGIGIRLGVIKSGPVQQAMTYESVSLVVAIVSLLLSGIATLVAKSSLSQAKEVAARDERDWRQRRWADMYLKADETYDALDRFHVLSDSWDTEEWEREWNDLMRLIRGALAMAVVFPQNPAIGAFLSSAAVFKDEKTVSEERLSKVFDAVELIRQRALLPAAILE